MTSLPTFDINYKYFLDKSAILYGETKSGKSSILVDILYHLKPHVDQIVVISPMDRQNHTYDRGIVPLPCIHYEITTELLDSIWKRQGGFSVVYSRVNKTNILKSLFDRIPNNERARNEIRQIYQKLKEFKQEIETKESDPAIASSQVASMEADCKQLIIMIWKHYINLNSAFLQNLQLSAAERYSLKHITFNPRLVLIFDDCTAEMKKFNTHPVMKKLFYQGRWAYITTLIACHTDKCIDPELKKGAFVSIFTEEPCASAYFDRCSNNFNKEARTRAYEALKAAFTPLAKYQKLVWVREDKKFYRFTATLRDEFKFCSDIVRKYCDKCCAVEDEQDSNNEFVAAFG